MKIPAVYRGPYVFTSGKCKGRKYMQVEYQDGTHGTTLYSRYLMEQHLNRKLLRSEEVDHVNEDNTDDRIDNFQILSHEQNASKSAQRMFEGHWFEFNCPVCGIFSRRKMSQIRRAKKVGKAGPFCSRKCARAWHIAQRVGT